MKNLTKIFMAVAVALFAFSCVQDATEDLGVKVGGQTELTLSIEESRTQLGEKAGSLYPVTWCEGDVVAVNGVASTGIEIVGNGTSATFTFPEAIARPWNVVYPAPAEGVVPATAGLQAVTFLATQEYKAGTFCDGAAPMYGVAAAAAEGEEAPAVQLNHLTGVLRFAVKGAGEKLTAMTVTTESGKIAGNFDVDCATGALTAHEDATNVVTVPFGEGLTLGEEATPIYVAVPAGEYGAVTVVLATDDAKKMTAKFGSNGEKQIKAGVVREFNEFVFVENDADNLWFEIYTVADMLAFAKTAANFPYTGAKVMAPIDMTGVEWTPIEGFGKVFDGGEFEIKGLKAPLFGTASATIKNVKLTEVDITTNGVLKMGSIVNVLTSNGLAAKASLTNCSASGKLTVSNPEWVPTSDQDASAAIVNYGGLVGAIYAADVVNSTNNVAITVSQMFSTANTLKIYPSIGGVVGYSSTTTLMDSTTAASSLTDCTNNAPISYVCTATSESKALLGRPHLGGVMGCSNKGTDLTRCENTATGAITLNGYFYGTDGASSGVPIGGVVGYSNAATNTGCKNHAKIELDGVYKAIILGGFGGYVTYCHTTDCHNYGELLIKESARFRGLLVGGVAGSFYGDGGDVAVYDYSGLSNNAPINILGSAEDNWKVSTATETSYYLRIGGITGFGRIPSSGGNTNNEEGDITVSGKLIVAAKSKWNEEAIVIAGTVGFSTGDALTGEWKNYGDITVTSNISYDDDASTIYHPIAISGVLGPCNKQPDVTAINYGTVTYNGVYAGHTTTVENDPAALHIAGIYAGGTSTNNYIAMMPTKSYNYGSIIIGEKAVSSGHTYVGGIISYTKSTKVATETINAGNLIVNKGATIKLGLSVGGFAGYFAGGNLSNVSNSGNIEVNCDVPSGKLRVAGICRIAVASKTATDVKNTGNITIAGTCNQGVNVGGIFAEMVSGSTGKLLRVVNGELGADGKPVANKGSITVSGKIIYDNKNNSALCFGGLLGGTSYDYRLGSMEDCHNYGHIYLSGEYSGKVYGGGIAMACQTNSTTVKNCSSQGDIIISGKHNNTTNGLWYTTGYSYTIDKTINFINFVNKGKIEVTATADLRKATVLAGYSYRISACTLDNCSNDRDIIYNGKKPSTSNLHMSGLTGDQLKSVIIKNGFINRGNIEFNGSTSGGHVYMSGLGAINGTAQNFANAGIIKNEGHIKFTGSFSNEDSKLYMGGLFATIPEKVTTIVASETVDFVNTGDVILSGSVKTHDNAFVGGIAGTCSSAITGAKIFANIKAVNYNKVGMITGSASETATASKCGIGGTFCNSQEKSEEWTDDEGKTHGGEMTDKVVTFDETNFFTHIYREGNPTSAAEASECYYWNGK